MSGRRKTYLEYVWSWRRGYRSFGHGLGGTAKDKDVVQISEAVVQVF